MKILLAKTVERKIFLAYPAAKFEHPVAKHFNETETLL